MRTPEPHPAARRYQRPLLILLLLSLIPAALLAWSRIQYEQATRTVALVMDYPAMLDQARNLGLEPDDLLAHYRERGVNAVAVYEDVVYDRLRRGELQFREGVELAAEFPTAGVRPNWYYLRALQPGATDDLLARYAYGTHEVQVDGRTWIGWPVDVRFMPAGPDEARIAQLQAQGLAVVYRPYDHAAIVQPAADWPDVPFIAFNGTSVAANRDPERLALVSERIGQRTPALIELGGSEKQWGIETLVREHGAVRLFALRPEWQATLNPTETASKYVLAARERNHRLLYLRPFLTVAQTDSFIDRLQGGLREANLTVAVPRVTEYEPSDLLRALSLFGPLIALALLITAVPLYRLGLLAAAGLLGLVALASGLSAFAAGALLAAIVFPAVGLALRRDKPTDWLFATLLSVVGVLFVAALGSNSLSMLGLEPFRGVSLTLVAPLGLFALTLLPPQDLRKTARDLYNAPIKLGDVLLILVAMAVVALVVLRRGNTPSVGVSDTELRVRMLLQDSLIRPRFKELVGHPLAIVGLTHRFPAYVTYLLLLGGVVGQASILNTFAHFHTPLLISLQRAFNGILIGGLIGFALIPLVLWGVRQMRGEPGGKSTTQPTGEQRA